MSTFQSQLGNVRPGTFLALFTLLFGIGMGISFGVNEDAYKSYIKETVAQHPEVHDEKSTSKIWRYAQRAHFHAAGIGAFLMALVILTALSGLKSKLKKVCSLLLGLGGLYPFAWFSMFMLAPEIGRDAAHHAPMTEAFVFLSVGGLLSGLGLLGANLVFGFANEKPSG